MIIQTSVINRKFTRENLRHLDQDASVLEACKLMRISGMDEILITEERNGAYLSLGIVTAIDIVTRVIALGLDQAVITTGDLALSGAAVTKSPIFDCEQAFHL